MSHEIKNKSKRGKSRLDDHVHYGSLGLIAIDVGLGLRRQNYQKLRQQLITTRYLDDTSVVVLKIFSSSVRLGFGFVCNRQCCDSLSMNDLGPLLRRLPYLVCKLAVQQLRNRQDSKSRRNALCILVQRVENDEEIVLRKSSLVRLKISTPSIQRQRWIRQDWYIPSRPMFQS